MIRSVLKKAARPLLMLLIMALAAFNYGFNKLMGDDEWLTWGNKCLTEAYDPPKDAPLKKWELTLTPDHFIRLRKTYQHGKQEYYSFNLNRLEGIDYLGTAYTGTLQFKTLKDDIIVQTYEDPQGDIDSMATELDIPVKNMEPGRLDSLNEALKYFKDKGL